MGSVSRVCVTWALGHAPSELPLGRALMPGGVCRAELSTQQWDGGCQLQAGGVGTETQLQAGPAAGSTAMGSG